MRARGGMGHLLKVLRGALAASALLALLLTTIVSFHAFGAGDHLQLGVAESAAADPDEACPEDGLLRHCENHLSSAREAGEGIGPRSEIDVVRLPSSDRVPPSFASPPLPKPPRPLAA